VVVGDNLPKGLDELVLQRQFVLEELLDRRSLPEFTESLEALSGLPIRILTVSGMMLADTSKSPDLYRLAQTTRGGTAKLNQTISQVLAARPQLDTTLKVPCFSGATYFVAPIAYDGQILGRAVVGPVWILSDPKAPLPVSDLADVDQGELELAAQAMPRRTPEDGDTIVRHITATLDVLVYSGLKAHLASSLHLSSVRESFRELSDKNAKLQGAYDRLRELDRLKSNFLATVSHELRTPLTSIIGYSEMLREGIPGELNEEQVEFVMTIHQKGEQLLELIQSLLDLSKLESGTMSLKRREVDCDALVRDVTLTLTPTARKKNVALESRVAEGIPEFYGDGERLRQVLLNLTENAIKFTPSGGHVLVTANLAKEMSNDTEGGGVVLGAGLRSVLELRVEDTGIGIAEEQRDLVFDAFYQVDNSATREVGGSGLGLSIVKRLVDAHDGQIRIESNHPSGTIFVVRLPLRKAN
jgi:two-component system, NarL family, sensor histidine kinase BarA